MGSRRSHSGENRCCTPHRPVLRECTQLSRMLPTTNLYLQQRKSHPRRTDNAHGSEGGLDTGGFATHQRCNVGSTIPPVKNTHGSPLHPSRGAGGAIHAKQKNLRRQGRQWRYLFKWCRPFLAWQEMHMSPLACQQALQRRSAAFENTVVHWRQNRMRAPQLASEQMHSCDDKSRPPSQW